MAEQALLFMKLTTDKSLEIAGEAEAEGFEGQIVLDEWDWAIGRLANDDKNKTGGATSGNLRSGEVNPEVFSFSKSIDRATTAMLSALTSGQQLEAQITLEEQSEADFEMVVMLSKVRIIKYGLTGDVGEKSGELREQWEFNFEDLKILYKPTATKGTLTFEVARSPSATTETSSRGVDESKLKEDLKSLTKAGAIPVINAVYPGMAK